MIVNRLYRWAYIADRKILVTVVGFGIGPKIAAENLLIDSEVLGENELIEWQETDLEQAMVERFDIRLLLNFGVIAPLPDFNAGHRIWIDCVDWLRTSVPCHIQAYDLLLRECFFAIPSGGDRGDPVKWRDIQPLIRVRQRVPAPDRDLILMSFGGIATPYSTQVHTTEMPIAFLQGACLYLDSAHAKHIVAYVPEHLLDACSKIGLKHGRLRLRPLARQAFQESMAGCGLLICQPGLYTPFEAARIGLPLAMTYPMSFTQDQQVRRFEEIGIACCPRTFLQAYDQHDYVDIEQLEREWFETSAASWCSVPITKTVDCVTEFMSTITNYLPFRPSSYDLQFGQYPTAQEVLETYLEGI